MQRDDELEREHVTNEDMEVLFKYTVKLVISYVQLTESLRSSISVVQGCR